MNYREEQAQKRAAEAAAYLARCTADDLLKAGMGATAGSGSDCYPYEVVGHTTFKSGKKKGLPKTVTVRPMDAVRVDGNGYGGQQEWRISPGKPEWHCETYKAFYKADGTFRGFARSTGNGGRLSNTIRLGHARRYCDPSF